MNNVVYICFRPQPLPHARPCVGGAVSITFGQGEDEIDVDLDLRQARGLLLELADAIEFAEGLERAAEVTRG